MLFSSLEFLYCFLPLTLLLYFAVPFKGKNAVLLAVSLFFYFYGEKAMLVLMLFSITVSYVLALLTEKYKGTSWAKVWTVTAVVISLGLLGFYKYADFFISNTNVLLAPLFHTEIPLLRIALPIGISFYTFQILSYNIDVYRGTVPAQKSFVKLATYVALFPQLIAGPIVRYQTIEQELTTRTHSFENFSIGAKRFVIGLAKKVLIANVLGELCDKFAVMEERSFVFYWLYAVAFSLHVFFDFSGYSCMAIGLGKIFGFNFNENFNYPFISKTIAEFWRRWHMSLGSWFRDYVYIPLGGNRVSRGRWVFNTFVVWFLTGFWHGAAWNFILWGVYFGIFLMLEKFFLGNLLKKLPGFVSHIYVLFFVAVSFVIFNATDMTRMVRDVAGMFGIGVSGFIDATTIYYLKSYAVILLVGILFATPIAKVVAKKLAENRTTESIVRVASPIVMAGLLIVVTAYLVDGSFNPFLYFRF